MIPKKSVKKDAGLVPKTCFKNEKENLFVYVLSNGQELTFKSKIFPIAETTQMSNGQYLIF